jgi:hypothetical protein
VKRQCHCGDDGDEVVFGACRRCTPNAGTQSTLPKLVPSSRFVVPESDPAERPYETTLSDGDGDLG